MPGAAATLRRKPARSSDWMTCSVLRFVQVRRPPGMAMLLDLVARTHVSITLDKVK
jgi:hypothetical protein